MDNVGNTLLCPVLGQTYNYFDDGKIKPSRRLETVIRKLNNLNDAIARITPNIRVANLYDKLSFTYSLKAKP
jgi:hypothetical protein